MTLQEKSINRPLNERTRKIIDKFEEKSREIMVQKIIEKGFESGPVGFRFWYFFRQTFWWTVWTLTRNNAHNWEDEVKRFVFFFCFRLSLPWRIWKNLFTALKNTIRQCCRKARVCCTMYIPISKRLQEWDHLLLCSRICFKNGPGGTIM